MSNRYRNGGTRGGASEFNWKEHEGDSSYLGASLHAPRVGRRDMDRDWFWWQKKKDTLGRSLKGHDEALRRLEILERQKADAELLADALGETTVSKRGRIDLEISEIQAMLKRGHTDSETLLDTERMKGLGAAPAQRHYQPTYESRGIESTAFEAQPTVDHLPDSIKSNSKVVYPPKQPDAKRDRQEEESYLSQSEEEDHARARKRLRKLIKKEKKAAKKNLRKQHKSSKKKKRQKQQTPRHDSSSSSSSSSSLISAP